MTANPASSDAIDISVSVVLFENDPDDLAKLLQGLSGSRLRLTTTAVDNSSGSALAAVASRFGATYIKTKSNAGFGAAHNLVLGEMLGRARYHLVVNPDIVPTPGVIDELFDFMEQHPEIGQTMPRVLHPDGSQQRLCKLLPRPMDLFARRFLGRFAGKVAERRAAAYEMRDVDFSRPVRVPSLSGCFMFLRDSVLQQTGLFDERYFLYMEDFDLCRRIGACSATVFYPEVSVVHGYAKGSYREAGLLRHHIASALRYFHKWGWMRDAERDALNRLAGMPISRRSTTSAAEYADDSSRR